MIIIPFNKVSLQNMQCFRIKYPKGDLKYLTLRKCINKNWFNYINTFLAEPNGDV